MKIQTFILYVNGKGEASIDEIEHQQRISEWNWGDYNRVKAEESNHGMGSPVSILNTLRNWPKPSATITRHSAYVGYAFVG